MRLPSCVVLAASFLLALTPTALSAGAPLPLGRYGGTTSDGHVIQFTVERSAKPGFPRKITHFYVVYDIAGCRSGPVRQPFFASIDYGKVASRHGKFARDVGHTGKTNEVRLSLTGRFTSASRASGSFRVGVVGHCPIDPSKPALTFQVKRQHLPVRSQRR
jgi:hypothetical protein